MGGIRHLDKSVGHAARALLLAGWICGQPALAQNAPGAGSGGGGSEAGASLEEVVVTATRRSEDIQKAPVDVSAVSQADIERAGVQNFADLQRITPNLAVQQAPGGFNFINIRGVGVGVATPQLCYQVRIGFAVVCRCCHLSTPRF